MRIRILARSRNNYSNRRFREEAKALGLQLQVTDPLELELVLRRKEPMIFRNGRQLDSTDVVLPRMGASITNYALATLTQFEMMGVPIVNSPQSIQQTRDKLRCVQRMTLHDIDIPRTVIIRHPSGLDDAIEMVGGFPIILKLLSGTQGVGVMLVENMTTLTSTLDTLWSLGQDILIQECVRESIGRDVRVIVIGGEVVGGVASEISLDDAYVRTAVAAARIVGLDVAGVDLLESSFGPKVIEVNSSPGMEGIEAATGKNIVREILAYAAEKGER